MARRVVEQEWGQRPDRQLEHAPAGSTCRVRLGDRLAPLIGAAPGTCVVSDTTTHNLHQVLAAALRIADDRDAGAG